MEQHDGICTLLKPRFFKKIRPLRREFWKVTRAQLVEHENTLRASAQA
jgi:hypothetical protein